jgi:transmembrane sensor
MSETEEFDALRPVVAAAAWRVHLTEAGVATTEAFEAWLAADARHRAAWEDMEKSWNAFGAGASELETFAARRAARNDTERVVSERRAATMRPWQLAAAAAVVLGAVLGGTWYWTQIPEDYHTVLGERRTVVLADGSRVMLDSRTEMRVRLGRHERNLELIVGQARFQVAHDKSRPFSVRAGQEKVVATGTDFNVDRPGASVIVTLIEGHVYVEDELSKAHARNALEAGQQLSVSPPQAARIARVDLERITAWQNGELSFDNEPLSSVVERVNRYSTQPIVVIGEKAGDLRVSGVFKAGDTTGFVRLVTRLLPLEASAADDEEIRLRLRR